MREIKFRGKRIDNDKWIIGDLISCPDGRYEIVSHEEIPLNFSALATAEISFEVDPETVGQFTGRKDINGSDLYPGDLIQTPDLKTCDVIHRIYWDKKTCGFKLWLEGYGAAGSLMQKL